MTDVEQNNNQHIPVIQQLSIALGILLLIFGTTYIGEVISFFNKPGQENAQVAETDNSQVLTKELTAAEVFENVTVEAISAYVWDVRMQRALFNKNADEQLPLASIAKLMTALVAYELIDDEAVISITIDAIRQDGDSGLLDGESFSLRNLTDLTLITSSNDGAYALATAAGSVLTRDGDLAKVFVDAMNIRAEEIGLSQTYFHNPTGLDISETEGGAYGSARDVAFLMEYIITNYPDILELTNEDLTSIKNDAGAAHTAKNTNVGVLDIGGLIASKTGYTDLAGGNLVIVYSAGLNRPIIISILGSSLKERANDVSILVEKATQLVSSQN